MKYTDQPRHNQGMKFAEVAHLVLDFALGEFCGLREDAPSQPPIPAECSAPSGEAIVVVVQTVQAMIYVSAPGTHLP